MKIVFLSFLQGFGGAEKQNIALANEMAERGHDVYLISLYIDNVRYVLSSKVKYYYVPDKTKSLLKIWYRYREIKKMLYQIRPDVVVNFWFQTAYLAAWMPKSITGKVVYAERGDPGADEYAGLLGLIRSLSSPRIDKFVFQSSGARDYFKASIQEKSTIIMNPVFVNREQFPCDFTRRKAIVTVGRLHEQKNQKLLIQAFSKISQVISDYILEIYGEGPLELELQKLIRNLNLEQRVFLKGTSSEIHQKIYDAALFVLSSDYEGLPNTLLEAMALGVPSISTDCRPGGARDIIDNGENGLIVSRDNVSELANAMLQLVQNSEEATYLGRRAAEKMKTLNKENIYNLWEKCFEGIVE